MTRLPRISGATCANALAKVGFSGATCANALTKVGFYRKRQHGSHIILRRDDPFAQIVVPDHRELDRGTLRAIIRQASLSVDQFVNLL